MLRAALIGLPSSGKTTLFQLMTSAKDAPRGKGDVNIGISKVPDARLDILTGMYNPKKRVPATVEFTDIIAPAKTGAQALVDVAGYKNADALVHVVRAFRDAAVPHAVGLDRPGARRAGDGGRADPRRPRRRRAATRTPRERSQEGPLHGAREGTRSRSALQGRTRRGQAAARAATDRRRRETPARISVPLGQAAAARHQPRRVRHRRRRGRHRDGRRECGPHRRFSPTPRRKPSRSAPRSSSRSHNSKATMPKPSSRIWDSASPVSIA